MGMSDPHFYITTPIYYVNDRPHIGHAYTTILADVLARYHRLLDVPTWFLTGTDEHGQKVQEAAAKHGMTPQEQCDTTVVRFQELWKKLEITHDDFIRTTEERHTSMVKKALQELYDRGEIYGADYEGWYCVPCERFFTEKDLAEGGVCPDCKRAVQKLVERNYFFKMSQYQAWLVDHIEKHPEFIQPAHRRQETLGFLRQPLNDLCISRPKSRLAWGIELPFDANYVTYVWFDALMNYVTAVGYGADSAAFAKWWPASYHLIGKDILTTHAVYWSTMLFALGLELPRTIFAHGWWLMGETKMSKSLGNIVDPLELIDQYGVDPVRYFLMKEMVPGQDSSFTLELFIKRYNSDLANDFGNLLNRVSGLIGKYFAGNVPQEGTPGEAEQDIRQYVQVLPENVNAHINDFKVDKAIEHIMNLVRKVNSYLEKQAPWKVAKTDLDRAGTILYTATEALRVSSVALSPVMPEKTRMVLDILGTAGTGLNWGELKPEITLKSHPALFPRIELPA